MTRLDFLRCGSVVLLCVLGVRMVDGRAVHAQAVAEFYRGRTVTLVIPTTTGGINDLSGCLVARHLGRFIPGQPSIVPENRASNSGVDLLTTSRQTPRVMAPSSPSFSGLCLSWRSKATPRPRSILKH